MINVGINGFGRIGRLILRAILENYKGKTVSTSLLRSIYISHKYNDTNMSLKEKKELGKDMLHSKSTAETIYHKLD